MARREVTFADLSRDPEAVARDLLTWQRGDRNEAIGQTLAASARETHGRAMTVWVWTGRLADGSAIWVLPVSVRHAQAFAPQGPARVLVALLAAAVDAGADPAGLVLRDWNGWVAAEAPGPIRTSRCSPSPNGCPTPPASAPHRCRGRPSTRRSWISGARAGRSGLAVLAQSVGAHPVEVAIALAAHGQPLEIAADDPDMVRNVRNWGLSGDPLPEEPDETDAALGIDDDPCPRRRHARRVLQRLLRMGKVGTNYHTAVDHLYRGVSADQRHDAMEVGEALIRAGLLGEKPSVGQRHVYLRRDALAADPRADRAGRDGRAGAHRALDRPAALGPRRLAAQRISRPRSPPRST